MVSADLIEPSDAERHAWPDATILYVVGLEDALASKEEEIAALKAAVIAARDFASDEVENRSCAGGSMSDYINEAQEVLDACDAALSSLGVSRGGESP